jgi:hypothetical protein
MSAANKFTICEYVIEKCPFGDPALANSKLSQSLSKAIN